MGEGSLVRKPDPGAADPPNGAEGGDAEEVQWRRRAALVGFSGQWSGSSARRVLGRQGHQLTLLTPSLVCFPVTCLFACFLALASFFFDVLPTFLVGGRGGVLGQAVGLWPLC